MSGERSQRGFLRKRSAGEGVGQVTYVRETDEEVNHLVLCSPRCDGGFGHRIGVRPPEAFAGAGGREVELGGGLQALVHLREGSETAGIPERGADVSPLRISRQAGG